MCSPVRIWIAESAGQPVTSPVRYLVFPKPVDILCNVEPNRKPSRVRNLNLGDTVGSYNAMDLTQRLRWILKMFQNVFNKYSIHSVVFNWNLLIKIGYNIRCLVVEIDSDPSSVVTTPDVEQDWLTLNLD
jgi:hypothetical protein